MYGITNITVSFAKRANKTYDEKGSKIAQPSLGRRSYLPSDKLKTSKDICRRDPENIGKSLPPILVKRTKSKEKCRVYQTYIGRQSQGPH